MARRTAARRATGTRRAAGLLRSPASLPGSRYSTPRYAVSRGSGAPSPLRAPSVSAPTAVSCLWRSVHTGFFRILHNIPATKQACHSWLEASCHLGTGLSHRHIFSAHEHAESCWLGAGSTGLPFAVSTNLFDYGGTSLQAFCLPSRQGLHPGVHCSLRVAQAVVMR